MDARTSAAVRTVNVDGIVDSRPVRPISWRVFALSFLVMLSEGYDLGVVGYAAPGIHRTFHIERAQMAPMFSMGLLGMLFGSLGAGFIGDRFGRKRGVLIASAVIGAASLACAETRSLESLIWCRLFVGIGLGGLIPNVTALMAEFLPRNVRGSFTTYAFMGITVGGVLPGLVVVLGVGEAWRWLFVVGAAVPLLALPLLAAFLPESVKFLALSGRDPAGLRRSLRAIDPDLEIAPDTRFVLAEPGVAAMSWRAIFAGRRRLATPLLWTCFASIMLVNFFVNSWLTTVLADIGFSAAQAAGIATLYYVGGVCGGLIVGRLLDRVGSVVLVFNAALGALIAGLIGTPDIGPLAVRLLVFLLGFSVLGTQVGMSATAGMLYPTAVRSKGAGFAHSIGRLGAISGPLIAGRLIGADTPLATLFLVPAVPLLVAATAFLLLTRAWTGRFGGVAFRQLHSLATTG